MDFGGFNWTVLTIIGPIVLVVVIAWALMRNRREGPADRDTEDATRQVYEEEEKAHGHESDKIP